MIFRDVLILTEAVLPDKIEMKYDRKEVTDETIRFESILGRAFGFADLRLRLDCRSRRRRTDDLADVRRGFLRLSARREKGCVRGGTVSCVGRCRASRLCGLRRLSCLSGWADGRLPCRIPFDGVALRTCFSQKNDFLRADTHSLRACVLSPHGYALVCACVGNIGQAGVFRCFVALYCKGRALRDRCASPFSQAPKATHGNGTLLETPYPRNGKIVNIT